MAVIQALNQNWYLLAEGGFYRVVVGSCEDYVVKGLGDPSWLKTWASPPGKWQTTRRGPVKNEDLWQDLLIIIQRYNNAGCEIKVWKATENQTPGWNEWY